MIPYYDPDESIEQVRANNRQALGMGSVGAVVSLEAMARKRAQEAALFVERAGRPAPSVDAGKTGWWEKAKPILVLGGIHGETLASGSYRERSEVEAKIAAACAQEGHFPIAAIAEFSW